MIVPRPVRLVVAAVLALAAPVALAPSSWAAKAPAASVTLTAPASGTSTLVGGVAMTGKAAVPTGASLVLTVDGAVSGSAVAVARNGTWSRYVYVGRVGTHELCGQVRSSAGAVLASSCVTWQMLPDPSQFSIQSPYEGQVTYDTVTTGGQCQPGASVRLSVDGGEPVLEACDPDGYGWGHVFSALSVGDHTLEASLLGADGSPVATQSVSWTVRATPVPDVEITSPEDGASGVGRAVTLAGTMRNVDYSLRFTVDGYETATQYVGYVPDARTWEQVLYPPYGTHELCVIGPWFEGASDTDCITYTALVEPDSFTLDHPLEGATVSGPAVGFTGDCREGTTVQVVLENGQTSSRACDQWSDWYVQVDDVAEGPHTATVTNLFEGTTVTSMTVSFVVDTTPPAAPTVTTPAPGATITTTPVQVYGRGDPNGTVTISWPGTDYGYASTYVGEDGTWTLSLGRDWFERAGVLTGRRASVTATVTQVDRFDRPSPATTVTWQTRVR